MKRIQENNESYHPITELLSRSSLGISASRASARWALMCGFFIRDEDPMNVMMNVNK